MSNPLNPYSGEVSALALMLDSNGPFPHGMGETVAKRSATLLKRGRGLLYLMIYRPGEPGQMVGWFQTVIEVANWIARYQLEVPGITATYSITTASRRLHAMTKRPVDVPAN